MDLFNLKRSVGDEFISNFSHLIAGYRRDGATLFLKVKNKRTRHDRKKKMQKGKF